MNSKDNLKKLMDGVESALSLVQSDFGVAATHYFEELKEGYLDPHDTYIAFKKVEKFVETILPFIKEHIDETKLSVAYKKHGVSLTAQNGRPTWDYSNCGDVIHRDLSRTLKETQSEVKEREKFLQSITKPTEVADEETGEVVMLNPPIKRQSLNVILRYNKDEE